MADAAELPIEGASSRTTINKLCQFCRNVEHPSNELCCPNCDLAEFTDDDDDDEGDSDSDTVTFEGGLGGMVPRSTSSNDKKSQVLPLFRLLSPTYSPAYMAAERASLLPEWNPRPKSAPAPGDWLFFIDPHYERGLMRERDERKSFMSQSKPSN